MALSNRRGRGPGLSSELKAYVILCSGTGQEVLSVDAEDLDPYVVMSVRGTAVFLTRDECRMTADALRAASLRRPNQADL
jgi:hypothetical protein